MPQIKCEYCGSYIEETDRKCPYCNAVNKNFKRIVSGTPRTIEELKQWYEDRNLPPEEITRFFIGKDIREARAFGIYQDGSDFIVYKNKNDGSRAIRYQGTDEAYAVNELYLKLKSEILNQKSRNLGRSGNRSGNPLSFTSMIMIFVSLIAVGSAGVMLPAWAFGILGIALLFCVILFAKDMKKMIFSVTILVLVAFTGSIAFLMGYRSAHKYDGYYTHGNNYYYFQGHDVYHYDNDDWYYYDTYDNFTESYPDYNYISDDYNGYGDYSDFSETEYYDDRWDSSSSSSSDSDYDSDYDWGWDSDWDSGGTDWDSDW